MKVLAFVGMLIGGRYLLRPVFRFIAASGVREVFTAATLLLVLGSALFMDALGLSMALGTFIAGVLLAESEYRHELETAIDPFKGLLLGLFFISVGMSLNLGVLYTHLLWVVISVVVLVAVKILVLYLLARLYGVRSSERMQFAGVLSQGGGVCLCPLFYRFFTTLIPGRPDGAVAGDGDAFHDDHAAADEAGR